MEPQNQTKYQYQYLWIDKGKQYGKILREVIELRNRGMKVQTFETVKHLQDHIDNGDGNIDDLMEKQEDEEEDPKVPLKVRKKYIIIASLFEIDELISSESRDQNTQNILQQEDDVWMKTIIFTSSLLKERFKEVKNVFVFEIVSNVEQLIEKLEEIKKQIQELPESPHKKQKLRKSSILKDNFANQKKSLPEYKFDDLKLKHPHLIKNIHQIIDKQGNHYLKMLYNRDYDIVYESEPKLLTFLECLLDTPPLFSEGTRSQKLIMKLWPKSYLENLMGIIRIKKQQYIKELRSSFKQCPTKYLYKEPSIEEYNKILIYIAHRQFHDLCIKWREKCSQINNNSPKTTKNNGSIIYKNARKFFQFAKQQVYQAKSLKGQLQLIKKCKSNISFIPNQSKNNYTAELQEIQKHVDGLHQQSIKESGFNQKLAIITKKGLSEENVSLLFSKQSTPYADPSKHECPTSSLFISSEEDGKYSDIYGVIKIDYENIFEVPRSKDKKVNEFEDKIRRNKVVRDIEKCDHKRANPYSSQILQELKIQIIENKFDPEAQESEQQIEEDKKMEDEEKQQGEEKKEDEEKQQDGEKQQNEEKQQKKEINETSEPKQQQNTEPIIITEQYYPSQKKKEQSFQPEKKETQIKLDNHIVENLWIDPNKQANKQFLQIIGIEGLSLNLQFSNVEDCISHILMNQSNKKNYRYIIIFSNSMASHVLEKMYHSNDEKININIINFIIFCGNVETAHVICKKNKVEGKVKATNDPVQLMGFINQWIIRYNQLRKKIEEQKEKQTHKKEPPPKDSPNSLLWQID